MPKKLLLALILLGIIGLIAYFLYRAFTGPIYSPGDLTIKDKYRHVLEASSQSDRPNFFELNDDISLHYFTQGEGEPALVIHGGPGIPYTKSWSGLDSLADQYQFYYYDQRGCGKSSRPFDKFESSNFYQNMKALDENLGLPAQIGDIEQIRRKLRQEKITLIGHSFGGFLACLYAIEFPEHVKSLILVTPAEVLKIPSDSDGLYGIIEKNLPKESLPAYKAYLKQVFDFKNVFKKSEAELVAQNKEFIKYYNLATNNSIGDVDPPLGGWVQNACFLSMGQQHDYSKALSKIEVPVLVLYGKEDLIPLSSLDLYLEYLPQASLKEIPNATHFPFEEQPELFGNIVAEFLESQ